MLSYANERELATLIRLLGPEPTNPTPPPIPLADWSRRYLRHYLTHPASKLHEWLIAELDQLDRVRGQRFAIVAPRGSAKTTWISKVYPLYCILHALEPYVVLISNTAAQAEKNLADIRHELTDNRALARDYPHACATGPVWNNARIETANGVCAEAMGMGTQIRGRTFGPHRPTLIVIDDLENDESVESPAQREKTLDWIKRAVVPMGTDITNIFVLGTALHRDDALQRLSVTPGWKSRTFRALIREPYNNSLWHIWRNLYNDRNNPRREHDALQFYLKNKTEMDRGAELLWPEREPLYSLMCLRASIGDAAFRAEKQGNPSSPRSVEWPDAYFPPEIWFNEWPRLKLRVIALDPSKGESDVSDFSAFVLLGLGEDSLLYVDASLARRDTMQIVEEALALAAAFHPHGFIVETNQFQAMLKDEIDRLSRERGILLPISGITSTHNKRVRIRTLTPYLRDGRFRFKANSPGAALLVEQLREFPTGRYDDGPDALQMAIELLAELCRDDSSRPGAEGGAEEIVRV